jgi:pyruvate/2-oxoglutarate/acetoin dehydrogenase E1 component/TPP-dependent pyruvate/acetoin dehydrogenase alpha subunit
MTSFPGIKMELTFDEFRKEVLEDYRIANLSRQCSIIGRKEVLTGKAKFGIFGDGKEIAQIAMAKQFRNGDWRSGYYRDQTFMFASGLSGPEELFAQLYGDTDIVRNPGNAGRLMSCHFSTPTRDTGGSWINLMDRKNSAADLSPTAAQMPKLVGLGYASKLFRNNSEISGYKNFSKNGNEVAFGMIGDASTSEGHFFETLNAAGVLQIPIAVAVWDDGYGISVPKEYQTIKSSISEALKGFKQDETHKGIMIYKGKGWDYPGLCKIFEDGIKVCREKHVPVLFHIEEMVQPLGHSTSGSHERYKPAERLEWEKKFDPLTKMKEWILSSHLADKDELEKIEKLAEKQALEARGKAWNNYVEPICREKDELLRILENKSCLCRNDKFDKISVLTSNLKKVLNPVRKDNFVTARKLLRHICADCPNREGLESEIKGWLAKNYEIASDKYNSSLYNETPSSVLNIREVKPVYAGEPEMITGREVLRDNFDRLFSRYPLLVTFGEDTGMLGDVNQGLEGLQKKYGELRISDTGIREATIIGQGIGLALRGLRPIAEIQYFDYLLYGLQTLSDDLATLRYRTKGGQAAPLIIRTRGHRLEGMWHSGSPLSMVINSIRGIYVCVPRDLTRAAGFYNILLESDDPALIIEPLNAYRLKEPKPENFGEFKVPLGIPEILLEGDDITVVTYGSCVRIAMEAAAQLKEFGINAEIIDVQTLLPFDLHSTIVESLKKTGRIIFFDEDVPGGATAFMMQKVLEEQGGFVYLDSEPHTITKKEHRPAYGTDGDYFSNPNAEDVFAVTYSIMNESDPGRFPLYMV